jgi:hypothetical protein
MASQLKVDTITGVTTAGSISVTGEGNSTTTNLQQGLLKAWINLNGIGTISIVDSFNIASISDNGTGDFMVNINNAMANTTWCVIGSTTPHLLNSNNMGVSFQHESSPLTTTRCRPVTRRRDNNTDQDTQNTYITVSGDLA